MLDQSLAMDRRTDRLLLVCVENDDSISHGWRDQFACFSDSNLDFPGFGFLLRCHLRTLLPFLVINYSENWGLGV
jgi:hypothetical protein